MAVHSEDQQKLVVTSSKGSRFGLCPRRPPRTVGDEDNAVSHIYLPLGHEEDIHARLKVLHFFLPPALLHSR